MLEQLKTLQEKNQQASLAGGADKLRKQHEAGKLTCKERIDLLLDPESFVELDRFRAHRCGYFGLEDKKVLGDGVVTGLGRIEGRQVYVYAQDFTVFGGSLSEVVSQKIAKIYDLALKTGCPVIGLNDSGGARIQEGVASLGGYADLFRLNTMASGVIPQISLILGPCAGGSVYSPALTDFIGIVDGIGYMFLTGPDVIKMVTHETVSKEDLGGAKTHNTKSGVAHFWFQSELEAFENIRQLLSYLPANYLEEPPQKPWAENIQKDETLMKLIPSQPNKPYDVRLVIERVLDSKSFFEIQRAYATNMVIGFGRICGKSVGVVANQPQSMAGAIDMDASDKAARFVRFCDSFNIPILTFVDVPGFLPGTAQEYGGIIRHGAKLLYAYAEASVPKLTVILRKAYGGAYCVMAPKQLGADYNCALPGAEIAVMGAEGAVAIIHREELQKHPNPKEHTQKLVQQYQNEFQNPYQAAELGYIDEVIFPEQLRMRFSQMLDALINKRETRPKKKHGNMPL